MKTNNFVITATNSIEGCPIERYIDSICVNVVVGANVFSDFAASFTDFFGGYSGSYKNKLELIYHKATKELKSKAKDIGANAIVGFSIDFDEISGGGKSMFMVSASGTACVVRYKNNDLEKVDKLGVVTQDFVDFELERQLIVKSINSDIDIKPTWMNFLYEHPQKEIVQNLLKRYVRENFEVDEKKFIERYFTLLPKSEIVDDVYSMYLDNKVKIENLIKKCHLFSPKHILWLLKDNIHSAIPLLSVKKDFYQEEDLLLMKEIVKTIDQLPDTGKIEIVKGGLLSKEQEKYICENGHKNRSDVEFCKTCDVNIKGLNSDEMATIKHFCEVVEIIESNI